MPKYILSFTSNGSLKPEIFISQKSVNFTELKEEVELAEIITEIREAFKNGRLQVMDIEDGGYLEDIEIKEFLY